LIAQSVEQSEDDSDQLKDDSDLDKAGYDGQDLDFDDPLEDFLPDTPQEIDEDVLPKTFSKWLDYDGKKILKTSFVATLSMVYSKKLTIQTFQNMGLTLETLLNSKKHDHELNADNDVDLMKKIRSCCLLGSIWNQDMLGHH
jgi:hypothetical protein